MSSSKAPAEQVLAGRVALVTGAAQGIGRAVAEGLARAGASVMCVDIQSGAGVQVATKLEEDGLHAAFFRADLREPGEIRNMVQAVTDTFGGLDILVNNARPQISFDPFPFCMSDWDLALNVMLKAPAIAVGHALPYLRRSECASVINVCSINAFLISQQPMTYHVAKAGLLQLTRYLAYELGKDGIRVNAVCPGLVDIADQGKLPLTADPVNRRIAEIVVPAGRAAAPHEVAGLVIFLASDAAKYMTGQTLVLDGGSTLGEQFYVGSKIWHAIVEGGGESQSPTRTNRT